MSTADFADQDVPSLPRNANRPVQVVFLVLLLGIGGFLAWASTATLARGTIAAGRVIVDNNRKSIQHLEGGIVANILIKDGDEVTAGQPLVMMSDTRARIDYENADSQYLSLLALNARLTAERDLIPAVSWPADLLARRAEFEVAEVIRAQQMSFQARRDTLFGQTTILEQRAAQIEQQVAGLRAQAEAAGEQIAKINEELHSLRELFRQGYAARTRVLALERAVADLEGRAGQYAAEEGRLSVAIGETRLQIIQLGTSFREEVTRQLEKTQIDLITAQDRRNATRDILERTVVQAPTDGVVMNLSIHTIGGVIQPGGHLLDIVPSGEALAVDVFVNPADIDHVYSGQEAEVRFTAFKQRTTPSLFGIIGRVSADTLTDRDGKMTYYEARVLIGEAELGKLKGFKLIPGMPVEVTIRSGERTALDYFITPFTDMFDRAFKED